VRLRPAGVALPGAVEDSRDERRLRVIARAPRVPVITTRSAKLRHQRDEARRQCEQTEQAWENYLLTARHDGLTDEIETLREFIEDLRLGIRSLDEYETVCCPMHR
jgi:hypothetical protein